MSCASKFQTSTHPRKQQLFQEGGCEEQHQASVIHSRRLFYAIFFFLQPLISLYWTFKDIRTRATKSMKPWVILPSMHYMFFSPWSRFIQLLMEIRHFTMCGTDTTAQDDHSVCTDQRESLLLNPKAQGHQQRRRRRQMGSNSFERKGQRQRGWGGERTSGQKRRE